MQRVVDGEEDNKESTEVTRKKGAIATKANLTAKKLAPLKAKEDKGNSTVTEVQVR